LGIQKYNAQGWSNSVRCPFKAHEHDHTKPAGRFHRDMKIFHCFKCDQTWLSSDVSKALGLDWHDYAERKQPKRRNGSKSSKNGTDAGAKPTPPTDDELG